MYASLHLAEREREREGRKKTRFTHWNARTRTPPPHTPSKPKPPPRRRWLVQALTIVPLHDVAAIINIHTTKLSSQTSTMSTRSGHDLDPSHHGKRHKHPPLREAVMKAGRGDGASSHGGGGGERPSPPYGRPRAGTLTRRDTLQASRAVYNNLLLMILIIIRMYLWMYLWWS